MRFATQKHILCGNDDLPVSPLVDDNLVAAIDAATKFDAATKPSLISLPLSSFTSQFHRLNFTDSISPTIDPKTFGAPS